MLYNLIVSMCLPDFNPITKNLSAIISEADRKLITFFLPGLVRMREWRLLFSIDKDGTSMQTFYN